ncbi:type IV secretion system protein [Bartonella mastomydis]|uniref:type IV secretion system protein n=1 Tax=Bartonella mastomydis TaxID=1820002 RepID=UPI001115E3D7|nr:type IV secretion system protein [Bartonella mastomydis]
MKKRFIITGVITLLAVLNLVPANAEIKGSPTLTPSPPTPSAPPTPPAEYLEVIKLLKKQLELSEKKFNQTLKIHDSITGNGVKHVLPHNLKHFLQNPKLMYPEVRNIYNSHTLMIHSNPSELLYNKYIVPTFHQEGYGNLKALKEMHKEISTRLRYRGVIARAVSLQALQNTEKRFERIANLLDTTGKTQDLKEATKLQAELKYMLAMIRNESIKVQMIRNFFNNEADLINRQKTRIYIPASTRQGSIPTIKFQ